MSLCLIELIQTELHHVRTLKIMTRLFRTGMLEELQLEPEVVQGLFPCVDELSDIHTRFLSQLLERRRQALCPGSTRNFVIHRLGDLLISQVGKDTRDLFMNEHVGKDTREPVHECTRACGSQSPILGVGSFPSCESQDWNSGCQA